MHVHVTYIHTLGTVILKKLPGYLHGQGAPLRPSEHASKRRGTALKVVQALVTLKLKISLLPVGVRNARHFQYFLQYVAPLALSIPDTLHELVASTQRALTCFCS